jgi:RND superfamily putative drug exporter
MFNALARLAQRHGRFIVIGGFIAAIAAGAIGGGVAKQLDPYGADDKNTESVQANDALQAAGYRETALVVLLQHANVGQASTRARVDALSKKISSDGDVAKVTGFYDTGSRAFVSRNGDATYLAVALKPTGDKAGQDAAKRVAASLDGEPNVTVGGLQMAQEQVNKQVEHDLRMAELLAFPLLFLLSLVFFRSLVASGLPLLVGGLAIVGTFFGLWVASQFISVSIFALNLTTGLGLGLAIDYSLFIVSRYREEIAKDGAGLPAMTRTMNTAGRTVLFSSLTVAAALASLLVFPQRFLYSMGLGGAMVALLAAGISLVVLPAILALLGERINALSPKFLQRRAERDARPAGEGFWYRLSRMVQRRPGRIAIAAAAFLLFLGIPFYGIKFTWVNAQILPNSASAKQVDDVIRADFPPFRDLPVNVVVTGGGAKAAATVQAEVRKMPQVAETLPPQQYGGDLTLIQAISKTDYLDQGSRDLVDQVRALPPPDGAQVQVTGTAARFMDFQSSLKSHLPVAIAIVVLATLIILFLMTGSVILPIKALLMNILNLSAVFGILVFVFQDGRLQGVLDYQSQGALEQTMPILLFAVAFGLSTDYGVFLLSRIKEARDHGASNADAVAMGLERTGRIVTAAALLFSIAIGAFATSQIIFIKENGVGTALAVLLDATIVRALLVPSLMELLGEWNWWAPKPLRWVHQRFGLSETGPEPKSA